MTPSDVIARLAERRAALWEDGKLAKTPAERALVTRQIRSLDAQIAAYAEMADRLAELQALAGRLAQEGPMASRLAAAGVDWRGLFAQLQRAARGEIPWPPAASDVLARLARWLGQADGTDELANVAHVIDGDGIRLADGREVRYIGMDAPEMRNLYGEREPWAQEATDANVRLVAGKQVRLVREVSDHDRYGRLLRHVYIGDTWVNGELVRLGLATVLTIPPDVKEQAQLERLQLQAQRARRGLWAGRET